MATTIEEQKVRNFADWVDVYEQQRGEREDKMIEAWDILMRTPREPIIDESDDPGEWGEVE